MKKSLQTLTFVLGVTTALALAQATSGGTSTQTQSGGPAWGHGPSAPASQTIDKHKDNKAGVDDTTLTTQVKEQLSGDAAMKNVQATVSKGVVDLEGTVASKAEKKRAKQLVAGIPGVRKVKDHLTVNANATATPGSNEPATASTGATAGSSASTTNTAGSIAGNAGASSTIPQTPSASAQSTTTAQSSMPANRMPQSEASPAPSAGVSGAASQTSPASTQSSATSTTTPPGAATSGTTSSTTPQTPTPGAPGTNTGAGALPQSSETSPTAAGLGDLQHMINTALRHEPVLANDHVNAIVSGDQIVMMGDVASGKERQTALRIAQSFAGNRRVVDRMTVAGQSQGAQGETNSQTGVSGTTPSAGTNGTGTTGTTNPASSPENTNKTPR